MNLTNYTVDSNNSTDWQRVLQHACSAVTVLTACAGCVTNAIIILVFLRFKQMRKLKDLTCLWVLAVADFLVCVSNMVFQTLNLLIAFEVLWQVRWLTCALFNAPTVFKSAVSLRVLALIPFDRMLAIVRPLKYRHVYNHRKRQLIAASIVILHALADAVILVTQTENPFDLAQSSCFDLNNIVGKSAFSMHYLPLMRLSTMLVLVVGSVALARAHYLKTISPLLTNQSTTTSTSIQELIKAKKRHRQVNKCVLLVLCAAVAFFLLPLFGWLCVPAQYSDVVMQFGALTTVMNSTINMFLYVYRNDEFRVHVKKLLRMNSTSVGNRNNNNVIQVKTIAGKMQDDQQPAPN